MNEASRQQTDQQAQTKGEAFYRGELAHTIIAHANANGSVMSLDDLATHTVD
ncbi:gamma-glutamyltransferase [Pseudomonas syringae pv. pisi str. 1704B]|uniref:Gamma-glutamyltransferase n=1 Tax=Pseudomonas syringae pv. pisi str. 1704B TaxID=629263 RepID=F3GKX0_PSESJ|nr:gamma-glutamyltransferase [Pseudomonas syringae pv. pisi str. 1704B]